MHLPGQARQVLANANTGSGRIDGTEFAANFSGASGFKSHRSMVAGPPVKKIWMTFLARAALGFGAVTLGPARITGPAVP